jgi:hypothetical protein
MAYHLHAGGKEMDIQEMKLRGFMSFIRGLRKPSIITVATDNK